jgi:gas vesicle protein
MDEGGHVEKTLGFFGGLVLGALVGGAVAMLLAPRSGAETQAALRARVDEVIDEGRRAAAERRAELEAQFAEAKRVVRTSAPAGGAM